MTRGWFHPSLRRLSRFAGGELEEPALSRLRDHLARCNRCRARVHEFRTTASAVRGMPPAEPRDALRDRIQAAVDEGAVAILPEFPAAATSAATVTGRRGLRPVGMGAGLLLLAVVGVLATVHARGLGAHFPTLQIAPDGPQPGTEVALRFSGASYLGDEDVLMARAELFDAHGDSRIVSAPLNRSRLWWDHRGRLPLPPEAVYAVLAVEDPTGERIESNAGRLWEVVIHDAEGRPAFEGLRERMAGHFGNRPDLALEAAQAMVEHHPERAESWRSLYATEQFMTGPASPDELAGRHRPHFDRLERRFEAVPPTPADLAAMTLYARRVADAATQDRWTARLLREAPGERLAIQLRLQELQVEHREDLARLVEALEELWIELGPDRDLASGGLSAAERLGDAAAMIRWAERVIATEPRTRVSVAERLASRPETRPEGIGRLRSELRVLETSGEGELRRPGESADERGRATERTRARLLAALGEALLESGQIGPAADTLLLATDLVWDPELYRTVAKPLFAQGDALKALPLLARISVDPETGEAERGELAHIALQRLAPGEWEAALGDAEARMRTLLIAQSHSRRLPPGIPVEDLDGRSHDLRALLAGEVAVVSLWYCVCEQFESLIDRHRSLTAELSAQGTRVVTVSATPPGPDGWGATVDLGGASPLLLDPQGAALRALGSIRTPAYFIVDRHGALRFSYVQAEEVRRLVHMLGLEERVPARSVR